MPTKLIVVHGYPLCDGGLGVNRVVLTKAISLFEKFSAGGNEVYILLPAGINEDTGEGKPLIYERQKAYLIERGIPEVRIYTTAESLSSDTWTEVFIAHTLCRDLCDWRSSSFEIHAIGYFPHSWKVVVCWRRIRVDFSAFFKRSCTKVRVYHTFGSAGSLKETLKALFLCSASAVSGIYDIRGEFWPARKIKERRREEFTPKNLQDKVMF